jgi:PA14 domain
MMGSSRVRWLIAILAAIAAVDVRVSSAQTQPPSLPANWQSLGPADFVNALAPFYNPVQDKLVGNFDQNQVQTYAATLMSQVNVANTTLSYQVVDALHAIASPALSAGQQQQIAQALLSRTDNWQGQPYAELRGKVRLMRRLMIPTVTRVQKGARWAQAGGQLSAVTLQDVPEAYLYFATAPLQPIFGSFSVHWQGQVTAPQTGNYSFSVSPINVNSPDPQNPLQVTATLSVGGNVVLTANAAQWTRSSTPISLTAGQPVALTMDWSAQVGQRFPNRALHALLYWSGPGLANSIVPQSALSLSDGSAPGLQATYTWTNSNGQQTLTRTEPNIDVLWTSRPVWLQADPSVQAQAGTLLLQNATASAFLTQFATPTNPPQIHPFFLDPDATGQLLTSAQRSTFLNLLQMQPSLFNSVDPRRFSQFYGTWRLGNPDAALAAFGTWATANADIACILPNGAPFDQDSRDAYRKLAIYVAQQMPEQVGQLQTQFLGTPDGRCCLPVAYTLAYANLAQNKLANWRSSLDQLLQSPTLAGDLRVNWLLARALAEEISQAKPALTLESRVFTRPTDGMAFLTQAAQAAQSGPVKVRVAIETAGRLAATGQFDAATSTLQPLVNSVTPDQQAILTVWINQISGVATAQANAASNQNTASQQAYLATLQQRRDQASAAGNTDAVNRYNALINALTAQSTQPTNQ